MCGMDQLTRDLERVVRRHGERSEEEVAEEVREIKIVIGRRIDELVRPIETGREEIRSALTTVVASTRTTRRLLTALSVLMTLFVVIWMISVIFDLM
jgi:hypothetical protein